MIELSTSNLDQYFSLPNKNRTALLVGKNPYDFVSRNSDTLVVTIGDSWTWGADLTQIKTRQLHIDRLSDDEFRLNNVYGGVLAKDLDADFLSLGESGAGNWHIACKLNELAAISKYLKYKNIIVVSIFTETGRDFNSHFDVDIDYRSWILNNISDVASYYNLLGFINEQICKKIHSTLENIDSRFKFYFGTNFVDPIGYDLLQNYFLDHTWVQIICKDKNINYVPDRCYLVFPWVIEKFNSLSDFAPEIDHVAWLKWINDITDCANVRANLCCNDGINFNQLLHPSAKNHKIFADYVLKQIHND